ncbi:MAG: hypothetical protein K2X63_05430 [Burkholderiaceae bacterium]|nr:hypothetical protein [Burkholderiaceae bacterium]
MPVLIFSCGKSAMIFHYLSLIIFLLFSTGAFAFEKSTPVDSGQRRTEISYYSDKADSSTHIVQATGEINPSSNSFESPVTYVGTNCWVFPSSSRPGLTLIGRGTFKSGLFTGHIALLNDVTGATSPQAIQPNYANLLDADGQSIFTGSFNATIVSYAICNSKTDCEPSHRGIIGVSDYILDTSKIKPCV